MTSAILLLILRSVVNGLIADYLTIPEHALLEVTIWPFIILSVVILFYSFFKLVLIRYQPSLFFQRFIIASTIIYSIVRFTNYNVGWELIALGNTGLFYIDIFGFSSFVILIFSGISYWRSLKRPIINYAESQFIADDPIINQYQDKLGYHARAEQIHSIIKSSFFKKSFTIGLVGPWGNGKSSLIELIQQKMAEEPLSETIHLKFLPYLNHNDSEIISEFFHQLSKSINIHSGKLANYLVEYSDRLLKLYQNNNLKDFLSPLQPFHKPSTSFETYEKINEVLTSMDKKFVVFIDDLDRLSSKEVLQVLKLVRNTANFRNFIFVIALDKDYVLNILIDQNDISDHTFIDKFFQLEIYLPEIDKKDLKSSFIKLIENSTLNSEEDFVFNISKDIYRNNNLFDEYISNYRDVKRLVNQLLYDYQMLPDELDSNDFLNFTYLKMKFPSVIKYLYNNWKELLPYDESTRLRGLKKADPKTDKNSEKDLFAAIRRGRLNGTFNPDLEQYAISEGLITKTDIVQHGELSLNQNILACKTLIALFGEENKNPPDTSIRFSSNLQKLLQQKISKNDVTRLEFKNIIESETNFSLLQDLLRSNKVEEFMDRIIFYTTEVHQEITNICIILLHIYDKAEEYGTFRMQVLQILNDFLSNHFKNNKNEDTNPIRNEVWKKIEAEYLENHHYNNFRKLEFLSFISENRYHSNFLVNPEDQTTLKDQSLKIFKLLLKEKKNILWSATDFSFYHAYHAARKLHPAEVLTRLVRKFWENNEVKLLCAQMIRNDAFTIKMLKTSDHATTIFGTYDQYRDFILGRINETEDKDLKEYREFLDLEYLTNFQTYIRFEFQTFVEVNERLRQSMLDNRIKTDDFAGIAEIYVECVDQKAQTATRTNIGKEKIPGFILSSAHEKDGRFISKFRISTENIVTVKNDMLNHFLSMLGNDGYQIDGEKIVVQDSKEPVIWFYSIQPQGFNEGKN